jgi:competence protein ComEC
MGGEGRPFYCAPGSRLDGAGGIREGGGIVGTIGAHPGSGGPGAAARRACAALGCLGAGMIGGRAAGLDSVMLFSAACLLAAVAALARARLCATALALAAVAFGAGWYTLRVCEAPADSLRWAGDGVMVTVEGTVLDEPEDVAIEDAGGPWNAGAARVRFTLGVDTAIVGEDARPVRGRARVRVGEPLLAPVRPGDRVRVTGTLRTVAGPMNPGEVDRRLSAGQDGLAGAIAAPRAELVRGLPPSTSALGASKGAFLRLRAGLAERARGLLLGGFAEPGGARAVLAAMVLGEEEPALEDVRSAFTRLGLAQVMAISGFNLAVMAWVALVLVRATGDRGPVEPLAVGALVLLYLLILPAEAPILRSGIMVLAMLAAEALGRRHDRIAVLAWTAAALLLWKPLDLWSMGFQLSFVLVGAMLGLGRGVRDAIFGLRVVGGVPEPEPWWRWPAEQLKTAVSTTVLCWALAMPIVVYHTGLVSPLALVATAIVLPPVIVMMWLAYALLVVGMLVPAAAGPAGAGLAGLAGVTVWLVRWMDGLPGASFTLPRVSLLWTGAAVAVVLYWCVRGYLRNRLAWGLTAAALAWLGVEVWYGPRLPGSAPLRIDTLAVGDGTCHLLRSADEAMLWDCGSLRPGVGRWLVPRAARALGAWHVRTIVLTHPNYDHYSGVLDAAGPLGVRTVLVSERFLAQAAAEPGGRAGATLAGLARRGIEVRTVGADDSLRLGSVTARFLSPPRGAAWTADNDHALVGLFTADAPGTPTLLMTGDIQDRAIEGLLSGGPPRADVMELPHHGSAREPAMRLVGAADPSVVLQSTGPSRAGDARWDPLRARRAWYTTATDGAAWAELRADGTVRSGAFLRETEDSRRVRP